MHYTCQRTTGCGTIIVSSFNGNLRKDYNNRGADHCQRMAGMEKAAERCSRRLVCWPPRPLFRERQFLCLSYSVRTGRTLPGYPISQVGTQGYRGAFQAPAEGWRSAVRRLLSSRADNRNRTCTPTWKVGDLPLVNTGGGIPARGDRDPGQLLG